VVTGLLYLLQVLSGPSNNSQRYDTVRANGTTYYAKPESIKSDGNILYFIDKDDDLVQVKGTWAITFNTTASRKEIK
jgi:hypothetical protein